MDGVTAQALHLVEGRPIVGAVQSGRRWNPELNGRGQDERSDLAPVCSQRERKPADGVLAPLPRLIAREEIDADASFSMLRAVVGPEREDCGGGPMAQLGSASSGTDIPDVAEIFLELRVEARCL